MDHGRDLAKCLASNNVALMRGHGFASAGRSLIEVVRMSVYLPRNARALLHAKQLGGEIKYLRQGEIDARNRGYSAYSPETWRAWEYWATKAGCSHMLSKPDDGHAHGSERLHGLVAAIQGAGCLLGDDHPVAEGFDEGVADGFQEQLVVYGWAGAWHPDAQA